MTCSSFYLCDISFKLRLLFKWGVTQIILIHNFNFDEKIGLIQEINEKKRKKFIIFLKIVTKLKLKKLEDQLNIFKQK